MSEPWNILQVASGGQAGDDNQLPVQLRLLEYDIETRCPLVSVERRGRRPFRKMYVVRLPAFPGYLFARATNASRARLADDNVKGVSGWMVINGSLAAVSDRLVKKYMAAHEGEQQEIHTLFPVGTKLEVMDGPLTGREVTVENDGGEESDTVGVGVDFLGSTRLIEVSKFDVKAV